MCRIPNPWPWVFSIETDPLAFLLGLPEKERGALLTPGFNSRAATHDSSKVEDEEDTADDTILSPPPSSSVSSVNPDMLGDEIVVGAGAHVSAAGGEKTSPAVVSEPENVEVKSREDSEKLVTHYPKRKRASLYSDLGEDKLEEGLLSGADDVEERPASRAASVRRHGTASNKSVLLGYWRDSPVPKSPGKHAVVGFMDVRDRLRTRIQQTTRSNEPINTRAFPVPPGPGGSWVTFERVVFEEHLVGLDHYQVKEFVKLRTSSSLVDEDEETRKKNDKACVDEAIRRVASNPPPETSVPPAIAYGAQIPESAQGASRPDSKRRRTGSTTGSNVVSRESLTPQTPATAPSSSYQTQGGLMSQPLPPRQQPQHMLQPNQMQMQMAMPGAPPPPLEWDTSPNLPGSRPTRIPVGSWSKSEAATEADKGAAHAVFGILGANDMFRVKLVRETLDGKYFESNFPTGAGALWINYDEVIFLPHLKELTRPEMKEYCRVRQCQIDGGEKPEDKVDNETRAVCIAQRRVACASSKPAHSGHGTNNRHALPHMDGSGQKGIKQDPAHELRYPRRDVIHDELRGPRSGPEGGDYRANDRNQNTVHLQRSNQAARQEILKLEGRYNHGRQPMQGSPHDNRAAFHDNVDRLNKVWQSQSTQRMQVPGMSMQAPHMEQQQQHQQQPQQQQHQHQQQQQLHERQHHPTPSPIPHPGMNAAPMENYKEYNGVRYERKQTGPFGGKLASNGTLINIDGEDYVEYRVLTKVAFF